MVTKVKLDDIIQELEMQFDDWYSFLNTKTGEIVSVSREELIRAEEEDDDDKIVKLFPTDEDEAIKLAIEIITEDYFVKLPTKFDVREYSIMEDFCYSIQDDRVREILSNCIRGKGAFGRFNDNIRRYGIEDRWSAFKASALKELAMDWCQDNGIDYME